MPSPRAGNRPRPVPPVQFAAPGRATSIMSGPFRGVPRVIRNGLPPRRDYRYRGTGQCMSRAEARYWLTEMNR